MRTVRTCLSVLLACASLIAASPALAGGADADAEATVDAVFILESGVMMRSIDDAFAAGRLTFEEARHLYQEQATVRQAYIEALDRLGPEAANQRLGFMIRTAWGTITRLSFNDVRRVNVPLRLAVGR